jgi:hypothetical protein
MMTGVNFVSLFTQSTAHIDSAKLQNSYSKQNQGNFAYSVIFTFGNYIIALSSCSYFSEVVKLQRCFMFLAPGVLEGLYYRNVRITSQSKRHSIKDTVH